jgi:hypothetical protein
MALANYRKVSKGKEGIDPWSVTRFFDGKNWIEDFGDDDKESQPTADNEEE